MTLDLLHNKIIKETLTESFEKSVNDNLVPKLYALYGTSLDGVQFYEDYINDDFIKDGYWYYPLTVVIGGIHAVLWIKWDISVEADFEGGVPYAYVGNGGIDFLLADDVPIAFKKSLEGRSNYFEGGYVKFGVSTDAPNPKILAGKYSQTFVDEMNRQISGAISRACGVKGLPESSIELDIVFAPNTYMEHTSENVTYRRLLISAKGCSARDFWIKWTRKNSAVAYSVNDNVTADDIVFELGEDVSQKIREKEYRFLVYGNSDKYRVAMGRKNVTEWRELIKRAVKRGELMKITAELEENAHVAEVSDKLSEILEKCGVSVPTATSADIRVDAEVANEALRLAVLGNGEAESENYVPEISNSEAVSDTVVVDEVSYKESEPEAELVVTEESVGAINEEPEAEVNCDTIDETEFETDYADAKEDTEAETDFTDAYEETEEVEQIDAVDAEASTDADDNGQISDEVTELSVDEDKDSVFASLPDDDMGEFDFGKSDDTFDDIENVEELTFEDILEQFIPKTENTEEDDEDVPAPMSVDIDDVDESESVRLDISKTEDGSLAVEEVSELETSEYPEIEDEAEEDLIDEENVEDGYGVEEEHEEELPELKIEVYEEKSSSCDTDEAVSETSPLYDEISETGILPESAFNKEVLQKLENEIADLKHQLEIERIAKENAESKFESLILEKNSAEEKLAETIEAKTEIENELDSEKKLNSELEGKLRSAVVAKENAESQMNLELLAAADLRAQNEKQKFAIEQVKKLVEEETITRQEAEVQLEVLKSEIENLKSENEQLREDNKHLKDVARVSEEACREAEQMCKQHERELLNQMELVAKEKVREKNLFAEAARQAKEESEQRAAEFKEAEIARITEEARIEALRRAEDERLRLEDELRFGMEAAPNNSFYAPVDEEARKQSIEERAREARLRMEEKARINAEAKASTWGEYRAPTVPVYENTVVSEPSVPVSAPAIEDEFVINAPMTESIAEEPIVEPTPAPVVNYTYTSYIVRLMFRRSADPNVTARIHEMISYALTDFGKDHIYMKVKASMPDNYTVVLNFVKFPEEEFNLLVDIINYLGKSDLGVYKVVLD